jgi:hypothetical protein
MAHSPIIRETTPEVAPEFSEEVNSEKEQCPHCFSGWVFEPTEDTLEDEAYECPMCFGTTRRMSRAERKALRAERDLDAHHSGLERMGS